MSDEEIHRALFEMKPLKAPGVDGIPALFYQNQWEVVGLSVCRYVKSIFDGAPIDHEVNKTLLVLIPKVDNPESIKQFRPISLCTVLYKIITKVIANRLKIVLPHIVGPTQSSFVPCRNITDNIIITQEVVHSMKRKKGKKGFMVVKVDLEKAYDMLSWDFIHDTLIDLGIPDMIIHVIMQCISTPSMQVLWNGEQGSSFTPSCGVRQGDPMSPYLFVLCIERLAHSILHEVQDGSWKPIKLGRGGVPLTHLFFADDLLLFMEASMAQVEVVKRVLSEFSMCSGLRVNQIKTQVFFSHNVPDLQRRSLGQALGFSVTSDLGKYLGVPLWHNRVSKQMYGGIIEKVKSHLSGWNASTLSLAGRITLAQSVLAAIPLYSMQTVMLPAAICNDIDVTCRRFIWGGSSNKNGVSLVNWDKACLPKSYGGLGFKDLRTMKYKALISIDHEAGLDDH